MKLDAEFRKLPLRFDADRLAAEVAQFAESDWRGHPQGHPGNSALPLIAAQGDPEDDAVKGPMRPTPHLGRCPYLRQVLAALGTVLGRTRLMRIAGQAEATAHIDVNYYWLQRVRVHVPIVTFPEVRFLCGGRAAHMAAGETWLFDTWRMHNVINPCDRDRIHLVVDTVGSGWFWDLVARGEPSTPAGMAALREEMFVPYAPGNEPALETETVNFPVVMTPWEQGWLIDFLLQDLAGTGLGESWPLPEFRASLRRFQRDWRALWARFGDAPQGRPAYQGLLQDLERKLATFKGFLRFSNGFDAVEAVGQALVRPALNPDLERAGVGTP